MVDETTSRPALAWRVGITGARSLDSAQMPRLAAQLRGVLLAVQATLQRLAAEHRVASAYQPGAPALRCLSPLARGADRLAAGEALALGWRLFVPMPFPRHEYVQDFAIGEDRDEFDALLARAEGWLALDGARGEDTDRSYEAVGRYVVRHSDLLIAIWDGRPAAGRGGTSDIVQYAAQTGVPVWWLHAAEDREPAWIGTLQDLRDPLAAPGGAMAELTACLETGIRPPPAAHRHTHGVLGRLARLGQARHVSPEREFFAERERELAWPWRAYGALIRLTSGMKLPLAVAHPPGNGVARYWFDRFAPVDARANEHAARYRSSYVWVFVLATLALVFGALALLSSPLHPGATWVQALLHALALLFALGEFAALSLIVALLLEVMRSDWHEHSIEYRLLAELYRKQQALAPLGWTLPFVAVRSIAEADRAAWVAWLFAAAQRAAPLPHGELAHAAGGEPRTAMLRELIAEQKTYHAARGRMARRAGRTLAHLGEALFGAVFACVVLKLLFTDVFAMPVWAALFAFLATVLPGFSAAFVGIRSYAELQLLAEQSHHMALELEQASRRIERLNPDRVLVSQDIGNEAALVATLMLQDLDGWARLFRVKAMEPG
jgi:hypothetical protein